MEKNKTVYDAIKHMTKNELGEFIFHVYNKGWFDKANNVDDESVFCRTMIDYPETFLEEPWCIYGGVNRHVHD